MSQRSFAPSHERGIQLMAAGCPLDYPEALPGHSVARNQPFRAEQLAGYAESRVYAISPLQTGYLIGLRLGTDRPSGTVISGWSFVPPWPEHLVIWEYEPRDIVPADQLCAYRSLFRSRLMGVLNDRCLLRRGYPVEGLLCGCSSQPIPDAVDGLVSARLTLVDDRGKTIALRIALTLIRRISIWSKTFPTPAGRLQKSAGGKPSSVRRLEKEDFNIKHVYT